MSYAIIKTGGKQFRVEPGRTYKIPSVVGEEGGKIEFNDVLLGNDGKNVKTGIPALKGASVTGEIVCAVFTYCPFCASPNRSRGKRKEPMTRRPLGSSR